MYLAGIILNVILVILLVLAVVLILVLFIPINYRFYGKINDELSYGGSFSWLLGCVKTMLISENMKPNFQVILFGKVIKVKTKSGRKPKKKNDSKPKIKNKFPGWNFIKEAIYFFGDILNIIRPRVFKITGTYGLEDPFATGYINAFLCMLNGVIPEGCIELAAVYDDEIIDIDMMAEGDLKLFIIGFRSLKFVLKKENRKIIFKKKKPAETF